MTAGRDSAMPEITVKFYTTLRKAAGTDTFACDAGTVRQAVGAVKKEFGADFVKKFRGCQIFLNSQNTAHLKGPSTKLRNGDTLHVFPPAAGG